MTTSRPIADPNGGERSLYGWVEGLKYAPEALRELARHLTARATAAVDEQPIDPELRESLRNAADRFHAAAEVADGWYGQARTTLVEDMDAVENPRDGSLHKESKSDVRRNDQP